MTIVSMTSILDQALRGGYAVGYFESWDQLSLEAVIDAAEEVHSPVIIGFGGSTINLNWLDNGGIEKLGSLAFCIGKHASVPTSILLNEAQTFEEIVVGLFNGCNAVMLDSSYLSFNENLASTKKVVEVAKPLGASVEGELGILPNAYASDQENGMFTDPIEAAKFVERTGVNALAVSIGNVHFLNDKKSKINLALLEQIHQMVNIPLVIHGGSGFPESEIRLSIECGVAKFNVGTCLKQEFLLGIQIALANIEKKKLNIQQIVGSREENDITMEAHKRMKNEIMRLMNLYGSAGKAT